MWASSPRWCGTTTRRPPAPACAASGPSRTRHSSARCSCRTPPLPVRLLAARRIRSYAPRHAFAIPMPVSACPRLRACVTHAPPTRPLTRPRTNVHRYQLDDNQWYYRTFLDAGEFGMGSDANTLGTAECGGGAEVDIHFFDLHDVTLDGAPVTQARAVCIFERWTGDPVWLQGRVCVPTTNGPPCAAKVSHRSIRSPSFPQHCDITRPQHTCTRPRTRMRTRRRCAVMWSLLCVRSRASATTTTS